MRGRLAPNILIAREAVSENSRSTKIILASACCRIKEIASASKRVLIALSTAPHIGTPKWASNTGTIFGAIKATVSPSVIPALFKADANCTQRL